MNRLLFNHQIAQMVAARSGSAEQRTTNCELVGHHAQKIAEWRAARGLSNTGWLHDQHALDCGGPT